MLTKASVSQVEVEVKLSSENDNANANKQKSMRVYRRKRGGKHDNLSERQTRVMPRAQSVGSGTGNAAEKYKVTVQNGYKRKKKKRVTCNVQRRAQTDCRVEQR